MWFRRGTLLLVIYLALDFANPMMPGAVQLVDGVLKSVAGCQARGAEDPDAPDTAPARRVSPILPRQAPDPAPRRFVSAPLPRPVLFRAPFEPCSAPPSSLDDD
jgi:hypothetical protein